MTKNVYIVQKWMNDHWCNALAFSSEKKAKGYVSNMAFVECSSKYRVFNMALL